MSVYPEAVYDPRTKENKTGVEYNAEETTKIFAEDIVKLDDEVVALQTEIGLNPKGDDANVKARLDRVDEWIGEKQAVNILSDSYNLEISDDFDGYKIPGTTGGFNDSTPVYAYLKPVKITNFSVTINRNLNAGEDLNFALYKDGVKVTDTIQFTDTSNLTISVVCDITINYGEGLSYRAWSPGTTANEVYAVTITTTGETVGNAANIEYLDAQVDKFNNHEVTTKVLKSNVTVTNTTNYYTVSDLQIDLPPKKYIKFEAILIFSLQASSDVKYDLNFIGAQAQDIYIREQTRTTPPQTMQTDNTILVSSNQKVIEHVQGVVKTSSNKYYLAVRFAQNTQQANNTIMQAGSFVKIEILDSYV